MDFIITVVIVLILSFSSDFINAFLLDKGINVTKCIYTIYGILYLATMQEFLWR